MENLTHQLTRTCNACGIEKPLSAFLQLSGAHGTNYGKICASCRQAGKTEKPASAITDDAQGTTPSGIGIRGKEKLYVDAQREQKIHTLKELYDKEENKKQELADKKNEQVNLKETSEKKHRESYINLKKSPVLSGIKTPVNQQIIARQHTQKIMDVRSAAEHHQMTLDVKNKQHAETVKVIAGQEERKTTTDFNNLFHAIEPGKIEMQGEIKRFFSWLGNSAPIVQTLTRGRGLRSPHGSSVSPTAENKKTAVPTGGRRRG